MNKERSMDILSEAIELLGSAVKVERHRGWAIFWCPFHADSTRQGEGGRPNFGVQLDQGFWKCLRCGASGPNLAALRRKLGGSAACPPNPGPQPTPAPRGVGR
jgi:hypothetical protein